LLYMPSRAGSISFDRTFTASIIAAQNLAALRAQLRNFAPNLTQLRRRFPASSRSMFKKKKARHEASPFV
jgi:hypothetical protein